MSDASAPTDRVLFGDESLEIFCSDKGNYNRSQSPTPSGEDVLGCAYDNHKHRRKRLGLVLQSACAQHLWCAFAHVSGQAGVGGDTVRTCHVVG